MLRGLTTVTYLADDAAAAARWYAELLGAEPYFARPAGGPRPMSSSASAITSTSSAYSTAGSRRRAIRAGTAGRSSTGMWTTCQPASGGCWNWVRPRANSRSSGDPDSSPHRSSTRSATFSA